MNPEASTVTPADLEATTRHCRAHLDPLVDRDWSVPVPGLDWTVRATAEHVVDALGFFTLHLASSTARRLRIDVRCHEGCSNIEVVEALVELSHGLAAIAAVTAPDVRAFHFHGPADASGFLALACAELLVHTHDILRGLDATLPPEPTIAGRVRERLLPHAPDETPPWETLLWATGRGSLTGHPDVGDDWVFHPTPSEERHPQ